MTLITQGQADKTKDIFVGMWRPPYPEIEARYKDCTIGYFPGSQTLRDDYLRGDFDEPLYRRIVEPTTKWMIGHPGTLELIECESFEVAMEKWFEGFNIPFLMIDGKKEDFAISNARVKAHFAKPFAQS